MDDVWEHVRMITEWLDERSAPTEDPRILRVFKISEEVGEVAQAVIGATGQNPRKGVTHTWEDVEVELCDVILAAMVALESVAGDKAVDVFTDHVTRRHERLLKLVEPKPLCLCCDKEAETEDPPGQWWCNNCVGRCYQGQAADEMRGEGGRR